MIERFLVFCVLFASFRCSFCFLGRSRLPNRHILNVKQRDIITFNMAPSKSGNPSSSSFRSKPNLLPIEQSNPTQMSMLREVLDDMLVANSLKSVLNILESDNDQASMSWLSGYFDSPHASADSTSFILEMGNFGKVDAVIDESEGSSEARKIQKGTVDPRELCFQLLVMRDAIVEEYQKFLRQIPNANKEIVSSSYLTTTPYIEGPPSDTTEINEFDLVKGKEGSTPFHQESTQQLDKIVTSVAINILRGRLDSSHVEYLDASIKTAQSSSSHISVDDTAPPPPSPSSSKSAFDVGLSIPRPRDVFLTLYHEGEMCGLVELPDGTFINKLKVARDLMQLRESVTEFASYTLDQKQREYKRNFRLVKESHIAVRAIQPLPPTDAGQADSGLISPIKQGLDNSADVIPVVYQPIFTHGENGKNRDTYYQQGRKAGITASNCINFRNEITSQKKQKQPQHPQQQQQQQQSKMQEEFTVSPSAIHHIPLTISGNVQQSQPQPPILFSSQQHQQSKSSEEKKPDDIDNDFDNDKNPFEGGGVILF